MRLVALDLPGGPAFVAALQEIWQAGDAVLPLPQRVPAEVHRQLLAHLPVAAVRDADGEHPVGSTAPDALRPSTGAAPHPTTMAPGTVRPQGDVTAPGNATARRDVLAPGNATAPGNVTARWDVLAPGDALVMATSGSTGDPKGVVLTHDAVAASAAATSAALGTDPDDHWLACLPLNHVGGLSVVTRALHTGAKLTVLERFDADAVAASPATLTSLVAATLPRVDHRRFRRILLGGAAAPPERPPNCVTTYGMTETGSGVVYDGRPLAGVEVRIDDSGEVHLRGPMLLRCYADGTDPRRDGWLATGDIGRWLDDGRLHIEGRRGDLIITGGENVWPEPIERLLRTHPGVADVAIVGDRDREWGQQVVAHVVPAAAQTPPTLHELRALVRATMPAHCAPRRLELVTTLPRTALGKLQRHRLAAPPRS